jgi:hypothetical protein
MLGDITNQKLMSVGPEMWQLPEYIAMLCWKTMMNHKVLGYVQTKIRQTQNLDVLGPRFTGGL